DVIRAALSGQLPHQTDPAALLGQPPVTLFRARRFYVDALFWVDGTTTIHDQAFAGSFQLLSGASIEATFTFAPSRDVDGHLRVGELNAIRSTLVHPGDVSLIPPGPSYIHSLFHLVRPSLSLVVRTFSDASMGVQRAYSPAGLGWNPFLEDPARDR